MIGITVEPLDELRAHANIYCNTPLVQYCTPRRRCIWQMHCLPPYTVAGVDVRDSKSPFDLVPAFLEHTAAAHATSLLRLVLPTPESGVSPLFRPNSLFWGTTAVN